jgi:predicted negative regulator of RcsB-dependent stress response
VSDHLTEEEQIAALKNWWKQNGNSLLIGVGAALAVVFGWQTYQNSIVQEKTQASMLYQQLVTSATQDAFTRNQEEGVSVDFAARELKEKFSGSEYALYGALFMARELVRKNELDAALSELDYVTANTEDARLMHIANGRKARILSAQGKHDEALALLNAALEEFVPQYLEQVGDIKLKQNDTEGALAAYQDAWNRIKDKPETLPMLSVKLADLGVLTDAE